MSELPRVMSVMGGPRDVSMPCPLNEAGGLRGLGERASLPEAACCGEKYEGEVAVLDDGGMEAGWVKEAERDGVEGLDAPRERADATELADGKRNRVGVVGCELEGRVCASSRRADGCPDGLRACEAGIALLSCCMPLVLQGEPGTRTCSEQNAQQCPPPRCFTTTLSCVNAPKQQRMEFRPVLGGGW
jgi:hypothetical protein